MGIRLLFYVLGFGLIATAALLGGELTVFLDAASAILAVGCPIIFAIAAHGPSRVFNALCAGLTEAPIDQAEATHHAQVLQTLRGAFIGTGIVAFMIGGVQMLQTMDDPSRIGPAVAVALLSVLYSVILAELIVAPMKQAVLSRTS